MKRIITFMVLALVLMSGCITRKQQVSISSSYAWEHRYTNADKVIVNGDEIKLNDEKDSFWILSNITLKNLIKQTANSAYMKSADGTVVTNLFAK